MAKKGKKAQKPKKKDGYKMPPPVPPGEVIQARNTKWKIGPSIGVGGFGEIYSAREFKDGESTSNEVSDYPYVVKIEPMENGPLFVEMHFYNRNYDKNDIQKFMESRNLKQLGMPKYCGSGSFMFRDEELRFLVLERYGSDLWKKFKEAGRRFPAPTVFLIGLQMLDVLDYIHSRSYIHADIKGGNILLGIKEGSENQAYLLDYGLAYRIVGDNYRPDPKSANEGTIEYTSTDRHIGAKTMRGDLEILGYNLLQWLAGALPWEQVLDDPKKVHKMKTDFMDNVRTRIATDYPEVPDELIKFFEYVKTLEQKDLPDYTVCRQIFETYLTSVGKTRSSQLEFPTTNNNEQPPTTDDLPSTSKEISNKAECIEINSDNELTDNNQSDTVNKLTLSSPKEPSEIISLIENDSLIFELNENQERITKNKKQSSIEIVSLSESDSVNELLDNNQVAKIKKNKKKMIVNPDDLPLVVFESKKSEDNQQIVAQNKKDKKKRNKDPTETVTESGQLEVNVEQETLEAKTSKKESNKININNTPREEIEAESELFETQELKVKRTKKNIKVSQKDPEDTPIEINEENDQFDGNKEQKITMTKKNKNKVKDTDPGKDTLAESDVQSETLQDDHQEVIKTKKNKKNKKQSPENIAEVETNTESEQTDQNLEREVTKSKKHKKKGKDVSKNTIRAEGDVESVQLVEEQQQDVTKMKKNKKRKSDNHEYTKQSESNPESDQIDDSQKNGTTKAKKKKRNENYQDATTTATENDTEGKDLENDQEQIVSKTKKSKQKRNKSFERATMAENDAEVEPLDEEHKIAKNKKSKKKNAKKSDISEKVDENDQSDNQQQEINKKSNKRKSDEISAANAEEKIRKDDVPKKKKKTSSQLNTPQRKSKRKVKERKYVYSDSESEFQDTKSKKKSKKKKKKGKKGEFGIEFGKRKLPEMTVEIITSPSGKSLRSQGKTTRTCFTNM